MARKFLCFLSITLVFVYINNVDGETVVIRKSDGKGSPKFTNKAVEEAKSLYNDISKYAPDRWGPKFKQNKKDYEFDGSNNEIDGIKYDVDGVKENAEEDLSVVPLGENPNHLKRKDRKCNEGKHYYDGCNMNTCIGNGQDDFGRWYPIVESTLMLCLDSNGKTLKPSDPPKDFYVENVKNFEAFQV